MKFGVLIFALSSPAAWAGFGNIVPNSSVPHRPCGQTTFERSADLLHKVALMPVTDDNGNIIIDEKDGLYKDSRGDLFELGPKMSGGLALNSKELDLYNTASPTLECTSPKSKGNKPVQNASVQVVKSEASGFLYGNGEQFATAAHALFDSEGNLHKSCVLRSGQGSELKDRTPLDMSMIEIMKDPTGSPKAAIAVIKLKSKPYKANGSPIEGIELNSSGRTVGFKEKLGVVSSIQFKGDRRQAGVRNDNERMGGPGKNPVIQECPRPYDSRIVNTPIYFGQCTTTEMASGSFGYSRDSSGKPTASVIFVGGSAGDRDGTTFRIDSDLKKAQYAHGVILDSDKVRRMIEFQNSRKLQGMEANARPGF